MLKFYILFGRLSIYFKKEPYLSVLDSYQKKKQLKCTIHTSILTSDIRYKIAIHDAPFSNCLLYKTAWKFAINTHHAKSSINWVYLPEIFNLITIH